ncbi:HDOD domain-containing protein [Neptuniibacter sp. 2_MG-2023]|uniref:HDOD domain-containing protein n=1 Tax=Neptuniibacter sp. 2_MG-2023 TaxID=3062671 RepID=UPI0026E43EA1|nr:HDOD domain-containing protein [Neptuniibacter sp. 2_MG-2023]MDO6514237.1 HDOD domain-containing protein [Neptuniibacter sp. 2_MG-2023]
MDAQMTSQVLQHSAVFCQVCPQSVRLGRAISDATDWNTVSVKRLDELLAVLDSNPADVLVLPLGDNPTQSLELLAKVVEKHPSVIRVVLSGYLTPLQTARVSELAHHSLSLDCSPDELIEDISNSIHIAGLINKPAVKNYITSLQTLPVLPDVYDKLNKALSSERSNAREIAQILEQDPVMTAKIMQWVNSAFFGLSRDINRIQEAVTILGVRMIRDLVLTSHLFDAYPQTDVWKSFSFKQIHQRSMAVARAAQHIARSVKADRHVQAQAFLAGLLHDFGILVLASQNPAEYHRIISKASLMDQPVYAIEKLELGVTHAEAGAYMLALWKLPPKVVEAVLFHHFPKANPENGFTPLTAVHVADALLPPATSVVGCDMSSRLSMDYIKRIGMETELDHWQLITADYQAQVGFV